MNGGGPVLVMRTSSGEEGRAEGIQVVGERCGILI